MREIELGRYDAAIAAFERMISLRPSLASYARIAYTRELTGDRAGAAGAMRLALLSAAGQPEPTAWAHVELASSSSRRAGAGSLVAMCSPRSPRCPATRALASSSLESRRRTETCAPRSTRRAARSLPPRPRRR